MIQLQTLNKVLKTKDASIIVNNNLDANFFSDYRREYDYLMQHYNTYGIVPDYATFCSKFPQFTVIDVLENDEYLLDELYKDKNERDLAYTFNKIRECIQNHDVDKAMQIFKSASERMAVSKAIKPVDIFTDLSRYDEYIEKSQDFKKYYISTGLPEIDELIGGWDRKEELATIIARSGRGKTWMALKFAVSSTVQGLKVGLYSGEMTANKVGYRLDTLLGHINNGSLIHGNEGIALEYKRYLESLPTITNGGSLKILTPSMLGGFATVSDLRAFIEREQLDILYVDQHSLLKDEIGARNPVEKASNISIGLKALQTLEQIPIICVSQMNRTKNEEDSELIDLTQISQSDRIGQDSTTVLGISRDKNDENILKIQFVKTRDTNSTGKVLAYMTDLNFGSFTFIPEEGTSELNSTDYSNRYDVEGENVF